MRVPVTCSGAIRLRRLLAAGFVLAVVCSGLPVWPGGPGDAEASVAKVEVAPIDLNSAPLEEVLSLPIPEDLAKNLVEYREIVRFYENVYDLMEVEGMTPEILQKIKPLVNTMPPEVKDASLARLSASYRQVQRYLGQEGSSEGLVDEYLDKMRDPENVNEMDLYDLMSYQNVSPVDATNILKARERLGTFESGRQLRSSEGLRYWAFRNLRDFVVYSEDEMSEDESRKVTGYAQTRYTETPFFSGDDDELANVAFGGQRGGYLTDSLRNPKPGWLSKIRVNVEGGYKAAFLTSREFGEEEIDETAKGYVGVSDKQYGAFKLKGLYLGNFRVAYGLGLIMDNTDFIHYRKTGFGFNKRLLGVHGDLSRSYEYHMTGAAVEGSVGPLNASFFVSSDRKDGIVNEDGTINRYITMQPRPGAQWLEDRSVNVAERSDYPADMRATGARRNAFKEDIYGGNVKLMLAPGTFIGVTGFEARYDKAFDPRVDELVMAHNLDLIEARDNEITNSYNSVVVENDTTRVEYKWRRVMGAEAQAVYKNMSVQGEYAFLQDPRNSFFDSKNPDAYIINGFAQWDNLHFLAVYRDYDVGFDNPYDRAFSNDNRYEMTLLDSPYRLNDDLYTWLETNTPQPKPEKGLYMETRYRISRTLTLSQLAFDKWQRKADGADMTRYTIKGEYQPIFNLRFRVRHRYSSRSELNPDDVRAFRNWETRWQLITMLSNYNRLGITYMTSNVMFPARPRLSGTAAGGSADPSVGTAGSPATAFEARYEHHLTPGIKFTFASSIYNGFFWNFEGNEFTLLQGNGFRNWFKVESRVSERLLFQLKITRDHNLPQTYIDIRRFGEADGNEPDANYVPKDQTTVRLQMDYTF